MYPKFVEDLKRTGKKTDFWMTADTDTERDRKHFRGQSNIKHTVYGNSEHREKAEI